MHAVKDRENIIFTMTAGHMAEITVWHRKQARLAGSSGTIGSTAEFDNNLDAREQKRNCVVRVLTLFLILVTTQTVRDLFSIVIVIIMQAVADSECCTCTQHVRGLRGFPPSDRELSRS